MRILLVAPAVDTCYEYISALGLMNLYLIGKELGCEMELLDLATDSYKKGLAKILSKQYDIIGISCNFTNAAPYCMRYARDIKQKYPNTMIISGGNHATLVYYLVKMYVLRKKIYVTKVNFKDSLGIFIKSLKQEFFKHENKTG